MQVAIHEAEHGLEKNGLPIGSAPANPKGQIVDHRTAQAINHYGQIRNLLEKLSRFTKAARVQLQIG